MGMNDANNDFGKTGDRPAGDGGGGGESSARSSSGSGGFGGGLLVASVSECDSSAFGDDFGEGTVTNALENVEEDSDTDDGKEAGGEPVAQRGSLYEDRFRQRSTASQQIMELADTVASDVATSPAHSNLIQRMTLVSLSSGFHVPSSILFQGK